MRKWIARGLLCLMVLLSFGPDRLAAAASPEAGSSQLFADVPQEHADREHILYLFERGLINGYPDGRFGPEDPLTRAAATKIATQVAGLAPIMAGAPLDFVDLPADHWAVSFVRAGLLNRFVEGFPDGTFRPEQSITRAELAALAVRATRQPTDRLPALALTDVKAEDWYYGSALLAVVSGMMTVENGQFRPNETATRAEAARAFARALMFSARAFDLELPVLVRPTAGIVEIAERESDTFTRITEPTPLPIGGRVRTGAVSTADISFPDGSALRLDHDSEMILIQSRGLDLISGAAVEDLEVELVSGHLFGGLVPRIDVDQLAAYQRYLAETPESKQRDRLAAEAVKRFMWATDGQTGANLPAKAARLMLFSDPASLEPGDKQGAEVTIVLVDESGEPVTADKGPVTLQLLSDVGTFSNANPVIPEGYQAVTVTLYPPAKEPPDAKTRVTAVAGDLTASLTVATAKEGWWDSLFSKKTRAKVRMPWSVASVRGTFMHAYANSTRNGISVLGGDASLQNANGDEEQVNDNQTSDVDSPESPPSNSRPMDEGEQQQWASQSSWVRDQVTQMGASVPDELRDEQESERERLLALAGMLPPDEVPPSVSISAPASGAQVGTPTVTVRGAASDDTKLASVSVNGAAAGVSASGSWSAAVRLQPGPNTITATATDAAGNSSSDSITVTFNAAMPSISLSGPAATKETKVTLTGSVAAPGGIQSVTVNGSSVTPSAEGAFIAIVDLTPGQNVVTAEVTDNQGLTATDELEIVSSSIAPLLSVSASQAVVPKPQVVISGQAVAQYAELRSVTVNGAGVLTGSDGSFSALVTLKQLGPNVISVTATDEVGNSTTEQVTVTFDAAAPVVTLSGPKDGLITRQAQLAVTGVALAAEGVKSLTVNGSAVSADEAGNFTASVALRPGPNAINVVLEGVSGRTASASRTVYLVTTPPTLIVSQPADGLRSAKDTIQVSGSAAAAFGRLASVTVNGQSVLASEGGGFSGSVKLKPGPNVVTVTATDAAGNTASESRTVQFNPQAPTFSINSPADKFVTRESRVTVSGTVQNPGALTSISVNGSSASLSADGVFSTSVALAPGRNAISVSLPAEAGGARTDLTVIYADRPPTLSVSAPADGMISPKPEVVVSGSTMTSYGTPARVSVGGMVTSVGGAGNFSHTVKLRPNQPTPISITATDDAGNQTSITRTVTYRPALPLINISSPANGFKTVEQRITVSGSVTAPAGLASVTVNGASASFDESGRFSASVALQPGPQTITVSAIDLAGGSSQASVSVLRGGLPPTISIGSPSEGFISGQAALTVSGSATAVGGTIASVTVNGSAAAVSADGSWVARVTLQPGPNTLTATVTDSFGTTASATRTVTFAAGAPAISLSAPADGTVLRTTSVVVRGQVQASAPIQSVSVNGTSVSAGADGFFQTTVSNLRPGRNTITATVTDQANRTASASVSVMVANQPPTISVSSPADGATVQQPTVSVSGSVTAAEGTRVQSVSVNGSSVSVGASGSFSTSVTLSGPGRHAITVSATDEVGNSASVTRNVTFTPAPPSVSASAPGTVTTATATISGSASSLYGGLTVSAGGQSFSLGTGGSFSATVSLAPGANSFTVTARDRYGEASTSVSITYNPPPPQTPTAPPTVLITAPDTSPVTGPLVTVSGTFTAAAGVSSLKVNGVEATRTGTSYEAQLSLSPGTHTITVELTDTENRKATATRSVTVVAAPQKSLTVVTMTGQYSDHVLLRAHLTEDGVAVASADIRFSVDGSVVDTVTTNADGIASLPYAADLAPGSYSIVATLVGSSGVEGTGLLTVVREAATLSYTGAAAVALNGTLILEATLEEESDQRAGNLALAGKVVFTLTGKDQTTTTEHEAAVGPDGKATVQVTGLLLQPYTLSVSLSGKGNPYYVAPSVAADLKVTTALSVPHVSGTVGESVSLTATLTPAVAGKTITFKVGESEWKAQTNAGGTASVAYTLPSAAQLMEVEASFVGDGDYMPSVKTASVTANPGGKSIAVADLTGQYSDQVTLMATYNQAGVSPSGVEVTFSVNGAPAGSATTDSGGVATVPYTIGLGAGQYTITATANGASGGATLTVHPEQATLTYLGDLIVSAQGGLSLSASITQEADQHPGDITWAGPILFTLHFADESTQQWEADVTGDGEATVSTTGLAAAPNRVVVSLKNSDYYTAHPVSRDLTAATLLSLEDQGGTVGQSVPLKAQLTPALAGETITFSVVDGEVIGEATTDQTGVATRNYTLPSVIGQVQVKASFAGSAHYLPAEATATVSANAGVKTLTVADVTGQYSDQVMLRATYDQPGASRSGISISFQVDDTPVGTQVTDANGVAELPYVITLGAGPHTVTAIADGASASSSLTVTQEHASVSYTGGTVVPLSGPVTLSAKVAEENDGRPGDLTRAGAVAFTLTGAIQGSPVTFEAPIGSDGNAAVQASGLTLQPYSVSVDLVQNSYYTATPASAALKAETSLSLAHVSGTVGETIVVKAQLTPAVAGKTITFKVGSNELGSSQTNADGVATFSHTLPALAGSAAARATFAGDANYLGSVAEGIIKINPGETTLTVESVAGQFSDQVMLRATFSQQGVSPGDFSITFAVDGEVIETADTNADGVAELPYRITLGAGQYTVTATAAGVSGDATLTVSHEQAAIQVIGTTDPDTFEKMVTARLTEDPDDYLGDLDLAEEVQFVITTLEGEVLAEESVAITGHTATLGLGDLAYMPVKVSAALVENRYYVAPEVTLLRPVITGHELLTIGGEITLAASVDPPLPDLYVIFHHEDGRVIGEALTDQAGNIHVPYEWAPSANNHSLLFGIELAATDEVINSEGYGYVGLVFGQLPEIWWTLTGDVEGIAAGDVIELRLDLTNPPANLHGLSVELTYDHTSLQMDANRPINYAGGLLRRPGMQYVLKTGPEPGTLILGMFSPDGPLPGRSRVVTLRFIATRSLEYLPWNAFLIREVTPGATSDYDGVLLLDGEYNVIPDGQADELPPL